MPCTHCWKIICPPNGGSAHFVAPGGEHAVSVGDPGETGEMGCATVGTVIGAMGLIAVTGTLMAYAACAKIIIKIIDSAMRMTEHDCASIYSFLSSTMAQPLK